MKKRLLAFILAITMVTSVAEPAMTYADTNPWQAAEVADLTEDEYNNAQTFSDVISAGNYLKEQLKGRQTHIVFAVTIDAYNNAKNNDEISVYHQAIQHTGNPTEGDYLYDQINDMDNKIWKSEEKAYYVYNVAYRTSLAEEQELTAAMSNIESQIAWGSDENDVEKSSIREIYRYICDNYAYDNDAHNEYLENGKLVTKKTIQAHTAYGAYKQKKAVCQGLADLFYRICLDRGIDCRIIYSNTHAWNAVKVGDKWYMCDATGDVQKASYNYDKYLLAAADLIDYDMKYKTDTYDWKHDDVMWDWEAVNGYDWAVFEYNSIISATVRNFKKAITYTKKNKTAAQSAKLYDTDGNLLKEGTDYTVTYTTNYDNNNDKYNTKVLYTGIGKYKGSEVVKYYNKKLSAPTVKRVTYKVIKNTKMTYYGSTKKVNAIQVSVYFDGVAGADYYQARYCDYKNDKYTIPVQNAKIVKCKNGEYCYTFKTSPTFFNKKALPAVSIGAYNSSIANSDAHKGSYSLKLPSASSLSKMKNGKVVKLKVTNIYKKHTDCYTCGTCKHKESIYAAFHNYLNHLYATVTTIRVK